MPCTLGMNAVLNKKGVTLVEVMVALVVLLIVFLGMIQTSIVAIQANMKNVLRDEGVRITADQLTRVRTAPFDDINNDGVVDPSPVYVFIRTENRNFRQSISVPFSIQIRSEELDTANKQVTVTTSWSWRDENFQHQILTTKQNTGAIK